MRILTTSDWHLGNLFHGNDRLPEHQHFLKWLLAQIGERQPDALLVAGDVFDNGNPSAASQTAYFDFLAEATVTCPSMHIVIIAGNHDSASRLEAPRPLLSRHKVEVRGRVGRVWQNGQWVIDYDDLIVPIANGMGEAVVVLAVPYLRPDVVMNASYSQGVNRILRELTARARELHPDRSLVMMAHMYAKGADIAEKDASEKIMIGGQEEVDMGNWADHPDYLVCGHIHKRQHIWNTDWARYSGSILPMSFAEVDYKHGIDMVVLEDGKRPKVEFLEYTPQHKLRVIPKDEDGLTPKVMKKAIEKDLCDRGADGSLGDDYEYVELKVKLEKVNNDVIKELEDCVGKKNAVLCKIQKILPAIDVSAIGGARQSLATIEDILNRDPLETVKEAFEAVQRRQMSERQETLLKEAINAIANENNDKP